jgi:cyclopropane fatty-acyl-phospholipid synthase-like methyltransferase
VDFKKTAKYDKQFVSDNLMGPNALKMVEELTSKLDLHPGMRVLDLGCGKGLTSIFLAKEF